jgi:hypothetical protein
MNKRWVFTLGFVLVALTATTTILSGHMDRPVLAQDDRPDGTPFPEFSGDPLPADRNDYFAGSGGCTGCHTNMTDESGADVSIDADWRSSMMANAARDPYWLASVRVESADLPDLSAVIQDKCATCHMPMAHFTLSQGDEKSLVLDEGLLNPENALHALAMDGISCTLCHQIEPTGLGDADSFSGGYVIDPALPVGERRTYSQFVVEDELASQMKTASGFDPVLGQHITEAKLCASCHTLYTPYVDDNGQVAGEFPEQTPYFEWQASDYTETLPCQGCHMPQAVGGVITSVTGGEPRSPFFQHWFSGGNAYLMNIFRAFGEEIGVTASSAQFEDTHGYTLNQLSRAASIALENLGVAEGRLAVNVVVTNTAGHKFPTGFPSRRAWLHFTITDGGGNVVFESGAFTDEGQIVGDDHDADPTQYEPHRKVILQPDDVQIYESIMHDINGDLTTTLLRGAGYTKDNRLLPTGFDKTSVQPEITPDDKALADDNFTDGSDRVMYSIDVSGAEGPFTVTIELLYQSISYRWVQKLQPYDTAESTRFLGYYDAVPNLPVVVTSVTATVDG